MTKRRDVLQLALFCFAAAGVGLRDVLAEPKYPERPIKLIIPFAPGSVSDALGRIWAEKMKVLLGPVFVENQGGAGGSMGAAAVARAAPDGYTILLRSAGSELVAPDAASHAASDPPRELELISVVVFTALAFVIHPSLPARSLAELLEYAKANPGKLSYGSPGPGTMPHLAGELFKSLTGVGDIVHVPYKGSSRGMTDLISGQIPMIITSITGQLVDLHRAGKVRILAVTTPGRARLAPDLPTAVESGVEGMIAQNFIVMFAPAGTPPAIVARIAKANSLAIADDEFQKKLIAAGFEPYPDSSPEAARRFVADEIARWTPVVKAIGLKLE